MTKRLIHDVSFLLAQSLVKRIEPLLREEEKREAFCELYELCKAALESYEQAVTRQMMRMNPSKN